MRGVKGSGPAKGPGKGRGRKTQTLADIAARSANSQSASDGDKQTATNGTPAAAAPATGRGRGRKSSGTTTGKNTGRRGASATNGQQRADTSGQTGGDGGSNGMQPTETNGVKIDVVAIPGRGGRPQQAEAFPFAVLDVAQKTDAGMVGPSFLIPENDNPDNVLAAARKRHKGKSFTARKMEGGVRIWRVK